MSQKLDYISAPYRDDLSSFGIVKARIREWASTRVIVTMEELIDLIKEAETKESKG